MLLVKPIYYIYYSNLSIEELKKALSDELTPTNMIPQKYYYGIQFDGEYNSDGSFVIKKTDWNYYGRHCKPHIYGKVMNENNETRIDIEIKQKPWCLLPGYLLIFVSLVVSLVEYILYNRASYQAYFFMAIVLFLFILYQKRRFKRKAYELIIPLVALLNAKAYYRQD